LENKNNQKEYYLTDLIALAKNQGDKISMVDVDPIECLGVNTMEELQIVKNESKRIETNRNEKREA